MNRQECDILYCLLSEPYINQRSLSEISGYSLGVVNRSIRGLHDLGYLDEEMRPTAKTRREMQDKKPKNAVILAAGTGMRMVPINVETPKALLEVKGEVLIERIIRQLHEVGVEQIYIVVGFMKEQFEYLIDQYGVELIVNADYARKNNLHSMKLALQYLANAYVIPCDIWCRENPFHPYELYSWYMVTDCEDTESSVRVNRKMELVPVSEEIDGNKMIGISYLLEEQADILCERITEMCNKKRYDDAFWEIALFEKKDMIMQAKVVSSNNVVEINTYEQLRDLDVNSNQLKSEVLSIIAKVLECKADEIRKIEVLKKGMTNRSFLFECKGKKYIMRIPGEGTEQLINRDKEAAVYQVLQGRGICDHVVFFDASNGYKITEYMEGARACNASSETDLKACMKKLRYFHELGLKVEHKFDIFEQIEFYESLWDNEPSIFKDYQNTKRNVMSLKTYVDQHSGKQVLTHIDAIPDNFLFVNNELYLIDWEYAGMQDPHVDIAMFCIYSLYNRQQIERLIQFYFPEGCDRETKMKIYCYISICGLLWSNWCEYKRKFGVEFGEYSLRQYRYAKEYYKIVRDELGKEEEL